MVKTHNDYKYVQIQKYKQFFLFYLLFLNYIIMEPTRQDNSINAFKEARNLLNECRSKLLRKETNEIRKKLHKKVAYNFLKEK